MSRITRLFHAASYLQYPLLLISLFFVVQPYFTGFGGFWQSFNKALIFAGVAISFSTLQDTTRTQNAFSRRIWQDPRKGTRALIVLALSAAAMLVAGLYGFLAAPPGIVQEVAFGLLMLGIGYVGLLKAAIEMFENHRLDKRGADASAHTDGP